MASMEMDLNDFDFDAYLANNRTLADPEVVRIEKAGRFRLRIVSASAATAFLIDTGAIDGRLVAVDGHDVQPVTGRRFGVAMAQEYRLRATGMLADRPADIRKMVMLGGSMQPYV